MHAVRTCKCKLFPFLQTGIRTVPQKPPVPGPQGCTAKCDVCNMCVPTYSSRSGLKCWCFGRGETWERKTKRENISFSKTKQKTQRDLNSLLEGYYEQNDLLIHDDGQKSTQKKRAVADRGAITGQPYSWRLREKPASLLQNEPETGRGLMPNVRTNRTECVSV